METNIVKLCEDVYGKKIGEALFAIGGDEYNGWDLDVASIYKTINGEVVAYNDGFVFPVESTNWKNGGWKQPVARGKCRKKAMREERISKMCRVWYIGHFESKRYGKNRKLSRRMWPNVKQQAEYEESLPF